MLTLSLSLICTTYLLFQLISKTWGKGKSDKEANKAILLVALIISSSAVALWLYKSDPDLANKIFSPLILFVFVFLGVHTLVSPTKHEHVLWTIVKYGLAIAALIPITLLSLFGITIRFPTSLLLIIWLLLPYFRYLLAKVRNEKNVRLADFSHL